MKSKIGVYICHCGVNIAATVDVEEVTDFASKLPNVAIARNYTYVCSEPGQELIKNDIKELGLDKIVVSSCSPRMHEPTFRSTIEEAGLNPYCLEMANIREQCSWVHDDLEEATEKAKGLVAAAVAKASLLEPLEAKEFDVTPAALVIGGGIAGIQAALDIADAGRKVYLVEKEPSIGGHMAQLDKTFPTLDCSACILTPKMVEVGRHPNIELMTYSEVVDVSGYVGNFKVKVKRRARYVDEKKCTGCGDCVKECPVEVDSEFEQGLAKRKAIYRLFPQAVPGAFAIEKLPSPCKSTCPAHIPVQGYIALIGQRKFEEALALIRDFVPFPGTLGRVCHHPCERECKRQLVDESVAVCSLKRFVADVASGERRNSKLATRNSQLSTRVAIVGSGPAGLSAAYDLARFGYSVTVFEALPVPGGMLAVGIPEYRLPKDVLWKEIEHVESLGVEIRLNSPIGKDGGPSLEDIRREYKAVFLAIGAHRSRKLRIPGEELEGVIHSTDFLRELNLSRMGLCQPPKVGKRVAIIGGGNSAVDAARSALRMGGDVTIFYRRSRKEMPAIPEEVDEAEKEGVKLEFLAQPVRIIGEKGKVRAMECVRMRLGPPDETGRRRPIPIEGSEFVVDVDTVIVSIGQVPDVAQLTDVEVTNRGTLLAEHDTMETPLPGVFAGGDAVTGPASVIEAIASGKRAAESIHRYINGLDLREGRVFEWPSAEEIEVEILKDVKPMKRSKMRKLPIEERKEGFGEINLGFSEEEAFAEAERCLSCAVCSECRECVKLCQPGAIDHKMQDEFIELEVGAIVVATGFDQFDARLKPEYGYGIYENVITGLEFERLSSASGPTRGEISINGKKPRDVVFIQCVGSRDKLVGNEYCSRVCCMYTAKQAHLIKEKIKDARVTVFYTDVRAFGKGFEEFYDRVRGEGIIYRRGNASEVYKRGEKLVVRAEDTLLGETIEVEADLVVLATGIVPRDDKIAGILKLSHSPDGFLLEAHPKLRPIDTMTAGIYLAGCCQGPKDIPDTVAQASAAAAKVLSLFSRGKIVKEPIIAYVDEELCAGCGVCVEVCPYDAREMHAWKELATVNEALCQGCGACMVACPSKASKVWNFDSTHVIEMIDAIL
jgi:heterodisulfide reductase subunit A